MPDRPNILVTGSHRSGTTWVGRMLTLSPNLVYVHEPFNVGYSQDLVPYSFDHWCYALDGEDDRETISKLKNVIDLKYPLVHHMKKSRSLGQLKQHLKATFRYAGHRWRGRSVCWKDPIALLSADQLATTFDLEVIVMIRHPAAFAGSLKKKGWTFPFEDPLVQTGLMDGVCKQYRDEISTFAHGEHDVVDQAALLWTILYDVVLQYHEQNPSWLFLRHEDVARSPLETFESLYDTFGLDFTESIRESIRAHSKPSGDGKSEKSSLRRHSKSVIHNWKERLTESEIRRVQERTAPVAKHFYTDSDW